MSLRSSIGSYFGATAVAFSSIALISGCGAPPPAVDTANINSNANVNANVSNANIASSNTAALDFNEPESYQGVISLRLEAVNQQQQTTSMPPLEALVARNGNDRMMQFALPTNEKIIYVEKGDQNFIVLPSRRQYAELDEQALGFEVRRMMMPEQIVQQLKALPQVQFAGEESFNGRTVQKYVYGSATNTGTQAGTVTTESYFLIDKETGLPLRSTTSSQSTSGGNVQGVQGIRLVTEMKDLITTPDPNVFDVPTDYQKIDPEQVKAQANLIFNAAAAVIGQLMNQAGAAPSPTPTMSPAANR